MATATADKPTKADLAQQKTEALVESIKPHLIKATSENPRTKEALLTAVKSKVKGVKEAHLDLGIQGLVVSGELVRVPSGAYATPTVAAPFLTPKAAREVVQNTYGIPIELAKNSQPHRTVYLIARQHQLSLRHIEGQLENITNTAKWAPEDSKANSGLIKDLEALRKREFKLKQHVSNLNTLLDRSREELRAIDNRLEAGKKDYSLEELNKIFEEFQDECQDAQRAVDATETIWRSIRPAWESWGAWEDASKAEGS